jgi:PmbA protein
MIDLELPVLIEVAAEQPGTELFAEEYSICGTALTPTGPRRSVTVTCGVGVRVVRQGAGGFASTSDCGTGALRVACRNALHARRLARDATWRIPADYGELPPKLDLVSPGIAAFTDDAQTAFLSAIGDEVRSAGGRLRAASVEIGHRTVMIAAPGGIGRAFAAAYVCAHVTVEATDADRRSTATVSWHSRDPSVLRPADLARRAVAQATARSAPAISPGKMTVVLAPLVAAKMILTLAPLFAVAGAGAERPRGSAAVTVTDDPWCSAEVGSAPFDAEGVATRRKTLIDRGEPGEPLADATSVARSGAGEPGNAARADYTQVPAPGPAVLILEPGTCPPAGLLDGAGSGLLAEHLIGSPRLDRRFGTIVLPVAGRVIRADTPGEPVTGTIIGVARRFLSQVSGVAKDLSFCGPAGAPSVRFEGLHVSSATVAPPA